MFSDKLSWVPFNLKASRSLSKLAISYISWYITVSQLQVQCQWSPFIHKLNNSTFDSNLIWIILERLFATQIFPASDASSTWFSHQTGFVAARYSKRFKRILQNGKLLATLHPTTPLGGHDLHLPWTSPNFSMRILFQSSSLAWANLHCHLDDNVLFMSPTVMPRRFPNFFLKVNKAQPRTQVVKD